VKTADALVPALPPVRFYPPEGNTLEERFHSLAADLRFCSQQGLAERFDSTIGGGTVLMPYGGRFQATPEQAMAVKLPVAGETATCAGMAFGFDPFVTEQNPYAGAYIAVADSVAKLAAAGFALEEMHLSFQEYFERLGTEPARWGKPLAALLGALQAQLDIGVAAVGGKDSMSGSFEDLDVPPTLVSFAVAAGRVAEVHCGEFQAPQSHVTLLRPASPDGLIPNAAAFKLVLAQLRRLAAQNRVLSVRAGGAGGLAETLFKMCLGNRMGFKLAGNIEPDRLFGPCFGCFVVELEGEPSVGQYLGATTGAYVFEAGDERVDLAGVQAVWERALEPVFPRVSPALGKAPPAVGYTLAAGARRGPKVSAARPRALIPVFPGTNCEYDTARALRRAGAEPDILVVCNRTPAQAAESAAEMARRMAESQMVVVPGGFSAGDEPEGSAKLICAFFRTPQVAEAVAALLEKRDGLMLGICNGFQALLKLGLLTHGHIQPQTADSPTLSFNTIGRHQSMLTRTRIASNLSPWLWKEPVGALHTVAVSHGEGRFEANASWLKRLAGAGQIAAQYVDMAGAPATDTRFNPPGSLWAVEAVCSPCGRVLGKMGHTERGGDGVYKNVPGNTGQRLFECGVAYYSF
jgi:phosphoribosylformylglycinamidine synthase